MLATAARVIAVGGGAIVLEEAQLARRQGVPVTYVATRARFPDSHGAYGALHRWGKQVSTRLTSR